MLGIIVGARLGLASEKRGEPLRTLPFVLYNACYRTCSSPDHQQPQGFCGIFNFTSGSTSWALTVSLVAAAGTTSLPGRVIVRSARETINFLSYFAACKARFISPKYNAKRTSSIARLLLLIVLAQYHESGMDIVCLLLGTSNTIGPVLFIRAIFITFLSVF